MQRKKEKREKRKKKYRKIEREDTKRQGEKMKEKRE